MESINNVEDVLYVFGDSHSVIFLGADTPKIKVIVAGYDGASISGLNEKTSRLEYGKHVINIITYQPKTYYLLLKMGQVDLEFVMYHKLYVKKEVFTFEEFCESQISKYKEFINKVLELNKNVIISSINLPSYHDHIIIKDYVKRVITHTAHDLSSNNEGAKEIDMQLKDNLDPILCNFSLEQLTKNFIHFNKMLSNLAIELNLRFFDTTNMFIDDRTKLLKNEYRDDTHHYKGYSDETLSDAKCVTRKCLCSFLEDAKC